MDLFHEGNIHFIDEDYDLAIKSYTSVINKNAELYQAYLHRGSAYLKCKNHDKAIDDFNKCLEINADCELAYYRLGVAYFESEEYRSAKSSFELGLKIRQQEGKRETTPYTRYIRKCEAELSDLKAAESAPPRPPAAQAATKAPAPAPTPAAPPAPPKPTNQPVTSIPLPIKYQYYQNMKSLTISVMIKNVNPDDVTVIIQPTHLKVAVKYKLTHKDKTIDQEERVIDKDLYALVDAEKSKYTISKSKIDVVLHKVEDHHWASIEAFQNKTRMPEDKDKKEGDKAKEAEKKPEEAAPAPAPSSSATKTPLEPPVEENPKQPKMPKAYSSKKDWDKVGSDIQKELEAEKPEGEEAMAALFRQIYRDADPETRMAMKKSFQTSGGTVLSTNWGEVKKTDYETTRQAPKGVEWKNWEGQKIKQKPFDYEKDDFDKDKERDNDMERFERYDRERRHHRHGHDDDDDHDHDSD